jgi:hypothetical protein
MTQWFERRFGKVPQPLKLEGGEEGSSPIKVVVLDERRDP